MLVEDVAKERRRECECPETVEMLRDWLDHRELTVMETA